MKLEKYIVSIIIFLTFFLSALIKPLVQVFAIYLSWIPIEIVKLVIDIQNEKFYIVILLILTLTSLYLFNKANSNLNKVMGGILFSIFISGFSIFIFEEIDLLNAIENYQFIITSLLIGGILISIDKLRN